MKFDTFASGLSALPVDCITVGIHDDAALAGAALELDKASSGAISRLVKRGDFAARPGETLLLTDLPGLKASRVLLVGQGTPQSLNRKSWRRAVVAAIGAVSRTQIASVAIALARPGARELDDYHCARAIAEITGHTLYRVNDLKSGKKPKPSALARVLAGPFKAAAANHARRGLKDGAAIALGARTLRDLANLPGNICTPTYIADQARALAKRYPKLEVSVLDEAAIAKEKMGCFLSVTRGSDEPPRFIVLQYRGASAKQAPIALVGKGITFDSGGISLKDPAGMDEMKFDMTGAASVLGSMHVVCELGLKLNVVGLIAACENMPSGSATKPGDIVTSAAGHTVEVLNTDAEGRLVLCDALQYSRRFSPSAVIDIATLTGAIVVALGAHHCGVFSNSDALARELLACGVRADDRAWQMPLAEEYGDMLKSNFADFANVAGREGGSCTAAAFLGKFTQGLNWAHLDIAGCAYLSGANKGSTGRPLGLLADFLIRRAADDRSGARHTASS